MRDRYIARRALLQQELGRLHLRLRVEALAHLGIHERVRNCNHCHPLMVRHEGAHDGNFNSLRQAARGVIQRLVEAVTAPRADRRQTRKIACRGMRLDHSSERGGVRRDHRVFAEAAFEAQARHAEVRILVGELQIARVIGRLGYAPGHAECRAVLYLPAHDQPIRLLQKAPGRRAHDERWHQILKHGARPGNERGAVADRSRRAAETKPMPRGDVTLRDGDETRQARLRRQKVVAALVESAFRRAVTDRQEPPLRIQKKAELHRLGHRARRQLDGGKALFQGARRLFRQRKIRKPAIDRALRCLRPEQQVAVRIAAQIRRNRARHIDQGYGVRRKLVQSRRDVGAGPGV